MRIGAFKVREPLPELRNPHAVAMLRPWIDAGNVGTVTLMRLESYFKAEELAKLARPGNFIDFTRYRPTIYSEEGSRKVMIPNSFVTYAKRETGNDFLFLHLLEPHMLGEAYVESVVRLFKKFGVERYCLVGSMYDMVPHTRPLIVTGAAVGKKAEPDFEKAGIQSSDYTGPTTIAYLISQQASELGTEAMSLIVHLPQYAQLEEDYMGATRLLEVLHSFYGVPIDTSDIEKAKRQRSQIDAAVDQNPQLKAIVAQLETHYETQARKKEKDQTPPLSQEIERFLHEIDKRFREG